MSKISIYLSTYLPALCLTLSFYVFNSMYQYNFRFARISMIKNNTGEQLCNFPLPCFKQPTVLPKPRSERTSLQKVIWVDVFVKCWKADQPSQRWRPRFQLLDYYKSFLLIETQTSVSTERLPRLLSRPFTASATYGGCWCGSEQIPLVGARESLMYANYSR